MKGPVYSGLRIEDGEFPSEIVYREELVVAAL